MKKDKYGIGDLRKDFPDDTACLEFLFDALYPRDCCCGGKYRLIEGRRCFQCSKCRGQISPMANTIFEKSSTPLTLWFHAIFVFSNAKSSISSAELSRQLNVTYKTAWRMLKHIRSALSQDDSKLEGNVETDSAYFGGRAKAGENNKYLSEAQKSKSTVMGAVQRGGDARVKVVPDLSLVTHQAFLDMSVSKNSHLMTDSSRMYTNLGYERSTVNHQKKDYVRGSIHINNMEILWGHMKRSIKGTHKSISKHYLQSYLDAFVFHYNNRHNDRKRFEVLLDTLLHA